MKTTLLLLLMAVAVGQTTVSLANQVSGDGIAGPCLVLVPVRLAASPPLPVRILCVRLGPNLVLDTATDPPTLRVIGGGTVALVTGEIPGGTVNGVNLAFTLTATPTTGSVALYVNGIRQTQGLDFVVAGNVITFAPASVPLTGYRLQADYR